ncbi:zinc-dependent metalloprotease family protein [Marinobacter sp. 1Y8]
MTTTKQWLAALGFLFTTFTTQAATQVVDILVLYTDDATQTSSGSDIDARIASYIEYSNQAYQNSDVDMQLRLVGVEQLDEPYTYVEGANLDALRTNDDVAMLRQQYGADLVTLINLRKPMNGGYVCGIGYVPPGQSGTGEFYSNAPSLGFSLVGVNCGYTTFAHELGHNMSLGHSYAQNSEGGIFPWARGYGVNGLFSTIMAYPQAFGTRNQVQQFSSPSQRKCEGQPCGVDRNQADGADSVANLTTVASQVAGFVATVDPGNGGGDGDGGDNGGDDGTGDLPICNKPELEGNLLEDGDFNALSAWSSFANAASLQQTTITADCGRDNLMRVTDRSQFYGGPVQSISDVAEGGAQYRLTAKLGIAAGTERDTIRAAIQLSDSNGTRYQYLPQASFSNSELSDYDETFTLESDESLSDAQLLIYGPQAGVDFYIDEVKLVRVDQEVEDTPATWLVDEGFENGSQGWGGYFGTTLSYSRTAKTGNYGLRANNRKQWYSGPGFDVRGVVRVGQSYQASVDVYLNNASLASDSAQIWAYFVDDSGAHWQKLGGQTIATHSWQTISAPVNINASGAVTQLQLHVIGPKPATQLVIDNFRVR